MADGHPPHPFLRPRVRLDSGHHLFLHLHVRAGQSTALPRPSANPGLLVYVLTNFRTFPAIF